MLQVTCNTCKLNLQYLFLYHLVAHHFFHWLSYFTMRSNIILECITLNVIGMFTQLTDMIPAGYEAISLIEALNGPSAVPSQPVLNFYDNIPQPTPPALQRNTSDR